MRKTQTTNGKNNYEKDCTRRKLNSQIPITSNLNRDFGQSDPMGGNASQHIETCTLILAKCECILALIHFRSVSSAQPQGMLKAQAGLLTSES